MTTQQPEALRLANVCSNLTRYSMDAHLIAAELRTQLARITELESQLAQRFDAADMATASAQGFRDGVASLSANAIMPLGAMKGTDAAGGCVGSLTEAVMGMTAGLFQIAAAIESLAESVRDK